jgi:hypothetical protein
MRLLGGGRSSRIERSCDTNALPAGSYYILVDEFERNREIAAYDLSFSASICGDDCEDTDGDLLCADVDPDDDNDGMSDSYETANGLNPNEDDTSGDLDEDGLTNLEEFALGTAANDADSDQDGAFDKDELDWGTDPLDAQDVPNPQNINIILIRAALEAKKEGP